MPSPSLKTLQQEIERTKELLRIHYENLQTLRTQEAKFGLVVPLEIINQIKEREDKIGGLQLALEQLQQDFEYQQWWQDRNAELTTASTIFVANLDSLPAGVPPDIIKLDHSHGFVARPRQVPPADDWRTALLPALRDLPKQVKNPRLIRLQGSCSLSTAFVFGQVFPSVGGRVLVVDQTFRGNTATWCSDEKAVPGTPAVEVEFRRSALNSAQADGVVIVYVATPNTTLTKMVGEVGYYLGEGRDFAQMGTENASGYMPQQRRSVLAIVVGQGQPLQGWQAAAAAEAVSRALANFIAQTSPNKLHLFLTGPFGLGAFIGHTLNQTGVALQLYEYLRQNEYVPSFLLA